jgi:hypothetical protein
MKKILYGIGKAVLRDFTDTSKVIDYTDLQDVSFESSYSKEDITGGNKMFPIASFKKDTTVKLSATNATFHPEMIKYMDGASVTTGAVDVSGIKEVTVPEDGVVVLDDKPIDGTVFVNGFTLGTATATKGTYIVAAETKTVTFAVDDAGASVVIVYKYKTSATAEAYSVTQKSMSKPFEFEYIFDVYDENTNVTHKCSIIIYKATTTSGFSIDPKHQSPIAPKFEAEAKDPLRTDGHLWDFIIDGVVAA